MRALKTRSADEGVAFHASVEPRVYESCGTHGERIAKVRALIHRALLGGGSQHIIELGAGTGDNCGPFSEEHTVAAVECSPKSALTLVKRFPKATVHISSIETAQPRSCDVLVLSEFLEHIPDPIAVVKAWGSLANNIVISHPLDEPDDCQLSAGEHQWSFSEADYLKWFELAGHELVEREVFRMGGYSIIAGRGRKP